MTSLDDILIQLQNPAPEDVDPELDHDDVTKAQLTRVDEEGKPRNDDAIVRSQLRQKAAASLAASDPRYRGKQVSRKSLLAGSDQSEDDQDEEPIGGNTDEEITSEEDAAGNDSEEAYSLEEEDDSEEAYSLEEEEEDKDESSSSEDEDDVDEREEEMDEKDNSGEESLRLEGVVEEEKDDAEKARAVVEQLDLWDIIMEERIKLQKLFSEINRLPEGFSTDSEGHRSSQALLSELSCELCGVGKETSIKRKIEDVENILQNNFEEYQSKRNEYISFWDDRTRLTNKKFKFSSFTSSVVKQVEQILSDKDRLLRRTQVCRDPEATDLKPEEIFDDLDFYQRQLRQLVDSKSEDLTSSAPQSQWLEIQQLKSVKKKKDVDTRASKGRKLRYNVHNKLVNFMTASDDSTWTEDAKNELFKSLFS